MHRIDSAGALVAIPTPAAVGGTVGYFTEGDPAGGIPATVVSADWLNAVQEEIAYVITQAGIALDKTSRTQLKAAIVALSTGLGTGLLSKVFANSPFTATTAAKITKWDTSAGNCVHNLPVASTCPGEIFTVVKTTSDVNTVTVTPNGSEKINNDSTDVLDTAWSNGRYMSIGTGWIKIN